MLGVRLQSLYTIAEATSNDARSRMKNDGMRYKITIEYDGTDFSGWQKQINADSVQESIENAIFKFSSNRVNVIGSGRTDAGVHALGQVAHFDLVKNWDSEEVLRAINFYLRHKKICILSCEKVSDEFHARFSATKRTYLYKILYREAPLVLDKNRVWRVRFDLNIEAMQDAAKLLIGKHDYTSFRAANCQANSPIKTLYKIDVIKKDNEVHITVSALSFLYHMVRNITGALYYVGIGKLKPSDIKYILDAKDRTKAPPTAPAEGLYFKNVEYSRFN